MKQKEIRGIESLKSKYGFMFVLPWLIGSIIFFAVPLLQSFLYSFSNVTVEQGGMSLKFVGLEHYDTLINKDPQYLTNVGGSLVPILYSLPLIVLISMVLGILLNQKFRGRLFFRALYFLPVIIATGAVIEILFTTTSSDISSSATSDSFSSNMLSVTEIMRWLDLPQKVAVYVKNAIGSIFDLVWHSGIQTVLVIAGLQSIPSALYEASKVEGANKWEEFWFITFPMLSRVTLLVSIFTAVELFENKTSPIMRSVYSMMNGGKYDKSSAMLWIFFIIVGFAIGLIIFLYNKFLMKRWE